jgi:hypothetical protein
VGESPEASELSVCCLKILVVKDCKILAYIKLIYYLAKVKEK